MTPDGTEGRSPRSAAPRGARGAQAGAAAGPEPRREGQHGAEDLERSNALLRATLESTSDGILVTEPSGLVRHCNKKFLGILWMRREETEGALHGELAHVHSRRCRDPQEFERRIAEIYRTSPAETFDVIELADGRTFERRTRVTDLPGDGACRVWSFRDVTERLAAEGALREETRVLEVLNQTGTSLASKLELQPLLQAVTDAATKLSGARFGAFFYNTIGADGGAYMLYTLSGAPREAFEGFGQPRATELFGPTFRGDAPIRLDDVRADPRYGKMGPHYGMPAGHLDVRSYLAVPVVSRGGEVIGGLFFGHPEPGVFGERTERLIVGLASQAAVAVDNARLFASLQEAAAERKRLLESERAAREDAERSNSMKDAFLATLSHELRTPLNAILGWSHVLRTQPSDEAGREDALERIERNARAQTRLIEDLLDMSRITSGKMRLDVQQVRPAAVVEAALEALLPAAQARGVRVERLLDPAAGPVAGDPERLQQVVWNLLSNAIKFTPKGGRVQVALQRAGSHVELAVADTGVGIRPEFLPHVFERFRQADTSSARAYGGLGLGLAIVKHLVELHGGSVHAASEGEGLGATFTVRLPLSVLRRPDDGARERPAAGAAGDGSQPDLAGVRVLVVDDEPDARDLIRRVLADCGAEVSVASSADEALAALERERPHVLLSDVGMPGVDGYELVERVRRLEPARGGRVPAIALTAFARSEDRTRALRAGYLVHLSKPVEPSELAATVASVARHTRRGGE